MRLENSRYKKLHNKKLKLKATLLFLVPIQRLNTFTSFLWILQNIQNYYIYLFLSASFLFVFNTKKITITHGYLLSFFTYYILENIP